MDYPEQLMCNSFSFHGAGAFAAYLQQYKPPPQDLERLVLHSLPVYGSEELPPMVAKFCTFLGANAKKFFKPIPKQPPQLYKDKSEDIFIAMPPLESFSDVSAQDRLSAFLKTIERFDILVAKVIKKMSSLCVVSLLCFANGKHRQIDDLDFRAILLKHESVAEGHLVRGVVIDSDIRERMLIMTINVSDLPHDHAPLPFHLGVISEEELPLHYKLMKERGDRKYASYLTRSALLKPGFVRRMLKYFNNDSIELPSLLDLPYRPTFNHPKYASHIEAKMLCDLSNKKLKEGETFYISKMASEAYECFQESLKLNPKNVDALLNCGGVHMYWQNHKKAIEVYEKVLTLDEKNEKAKQFLCKCLQVLLKRYNEAKDYKELFLCCKRLLVLDPDYQEAQIGVARSLYELAYQLLIGEQLFLDEPKPAENVCSGSDMDVDDTTRAESKIVEIGKPQAVSRSLSEYITLMQGCDKSAKDAVMPKPAPSTQQSNSDAQYGPAVDTPGSNWYLQWGTRRFPEEGYSAGSSKAAEDTLKQQCDEFISENLSKNTGHRTAKSLKEKRHKTHRASSKHHHRHHRRHGEKKRRRRSKASPETDDSSSYSSTSDRTVMSYQRDMSELVESTKMRSLLPRGVHRYPESPVSRSRERYRSRSREGSDAARSPSRTRHRRSTSRRPSVEGATRRLMSLRSRSPSLGRRFGPSTPDRRDVSPPARRHVDPPSSSCGEDSNSIPPYKLGPPSYSVASKAPAVEILNSILDHTINKK